MKNILPYTSKNMVKMVKKVCIDVIDWLKIWKKSFKMVKMVKILNKFFNHNFNQFLTKEFRYAEGFFNQFNQFNHKNTQIQKKSFLGA